MDTEAEAKGSDPSYLKEISKWILWALSGFKPMLRNIRVDIELHIDRYVRFIEKRLMWLMFFFSTIFLCVFLTLFGLLFMLIDYCSLNRGIACLSCGLFTALLLVLLLKMAK